MQPLRERNSAILPVLTQWAQNAIVILELEVNDRDLRAFTHSQRQAAISNFIANLLHLAEREGFDAHAIYACGLATFASECRAAMPAYLASSITAAARIAPLSMNDRMIVAQRDVNGTQREAVEQDGGSL